MDHIAPIIWPQDKRIGKLITLTSLVQSVMGFKYSLLVLKSGVNTKYLFG